MKPAGWASITPEQRAFLEQLLTERQLVALRLHLNGAGYKRIGRILGITPQAAHARVDAARRRLAQHHQENPAA